MVSEAVEVAGDDEGAGRLMNRSLSRGWSGWREVVGARAEALQLMQRACAS